MSANPFWEFSLDVYARPGVADACIALQDEAGLDVNLILFCLWSGAQGPGRLDAGDLRRAIALTSGWQDDVVKPVRAARRAARNAKTAGGAGLFAMAFQRDIAATELSAERVEQWLLFDAAPETERGEPGEADALRMACENLAGYLKARGANAAAARARLETLLAASFPASGTDDVRRALAVKPGTKPGTGP